LCQQDIDEMRRRRMFLGHLCLRFSDSRQSRHARSLHLCRGGNPRLDRLTADDGSAAHGSKQPLPVPAPPSIRLQQSAPVVAFKL